MEIENSIMEYQELGRSYSKRNSQYFRKFYLIFSDKKIVNACVRNLNWAHFRSLICVSDENRLLKSSKNKRVNAEMQRKTAEYQKDKYKLYEGPQVEDLTENLEFMTENFKSLLSAIEEIENELREVTGNE